MIDKESLEDPTPLNTESGKTKRSEIESRESTRSFPEFRVIELDKTFYIMYYSILAFIFSNSIGFYLVIDESIPVLILGIVTSIFITLVSILIFIREKNRLLSNEAIISMCLVLYMATGFAIIITDPQVVVLISGTVNSTHNLNFLLLMCLYTIGSKYMIKIKSVFFLTSYSMIVTAFTLGCFGVESMFQHVLKFIIILIFIYFLSIEIKDYRDIYNIIITEDCSEFKMENPNTPMEEILIEIHDGIQKIMDVSKITTPNIQKMYTKIVKLLKKITAKIQNSKNIYLPNLELVTKNMDEDDKLYIQQEFFHGQKFNRRYSECSIIERKTVENGISELSEILKKIGHEWNFNLFFIAEFTKSPLAIIGKYTIKMYGLDDLYSISDEILEGFLTEVESRYPSNPYHNSTHATDVMCSFIFFLTNSRLSDYMNSLEWFAGIIASLCHDIGHPGKNNRFLVMTGHEIALTYNDISVLEMMHASSIFQISSKLNLNIFKNLSHEKLTQIRKLIIDMILATDMSKHFDLLSYTRTKYNENSDLSSWDVRADIFKICLKSADVGHAGKSIELHQKWCNLITEEFFAQGDIEKEMGLPISMYCDKKSTNIPKSQVGFIKNIVYNLFTAMNCILKSDQIEEFCTNQLKRNEAHWSLLCKPRNLSSIHKNSNTKEEVLFPLIERITSRKTSLPPLLINPNV
jgi:3'5'-cyclic nucleotide phosphodiesterase